MAPGFQVLVARNTKVVFTKSYGYHTDKKKNLVKNTDIYDVASLTKILGALPLIMKAQEDNKISLDNSLMQVLPSFKDSNKDTVTLKEILSHFGRLKPWIPFLQKNTRQYYR